MALGDVPAKERFAAGSSDFEFHDPTCPPGSTIPVHVFVPKGAKSDAPVLFVLHGTKRDALGYRDVWRPLAQDHGALLVCPEFSEASYPSSGKYNCGNVLDDAHRPRREDMWTFTVIERLFDEIQRRSGNRSKRYCLYGHSAGAQFVHRLVLLLPGARVERAVAANAGWYTFPVLDTAYPYGLAGVRSDEDMQANLRVALGKPLTILLGEEDTDTEDADLRSTPEAMAQGEHRLARGRRFLDVARAQARDRAVELAWTLETVPGAGHKNADMARAAAKILFPATRTAARR